MLKKHKIIIIISVIIVCLILLIAILIPNINKNNLENAKYSNIQSIPSNEAAVSIMKCKYIKEEKSTAPGYDIDIYLEFAKPLFDGEESNEIYYSQLIQLMANKNNYINFRLIDEAKLIVIAVICDKQAQEIAQTIINGDSNYYGRAESFKNLSEFTRSKITNLTIDSELLQTLIDDEWDLRYQILETPEEMDNNYYFYPVTGIQVKNINNKVFNILFEKEYKGNVLNGLNANSTLEQVVQVLGKPTFGSIEEKTIGYKSNKIYVFFSEDVVSIYRVEEYSTDEFEQEVENYQYTNDIKTYISNITDIWEDYDNYYYDSNTVDLAYTLKGVKIQYGVIINHGLTIYTNYKGKINNKEIEELQPEDVPKEVYFENKDSVAEYELQRAESHRLLNYSGDEEDQRVW